MRSPQMGLLDDTGWRILDALQSDSRLSFNELARQVGLMSPMLPTSALQGGPAFTLTVTGRGFVPASVVRWDGSIRTTTFVIATQLTATILAADLASAGTPASSS